jgi:hypothetical protein
MLKTFISNLNHKNEFSWVIESQMLVLPFDIKRLNHLNLKQGELPNWQTTTSYYHTNFINIFQIYIHHKNFKNIIESLMATKWIVSYEIQMTQLPILEIMVIIFSIMCCGECNISFHNFPYTTPKCVLIHFGFH